MLAMLKEGSTGLRDLTTDLENSGGTAKKVADTQLKGFAGAMVKLKSATEGLAIEFGDVLIPLINKMVKLLNKLISKWTALDSDMKVVIVTVGIFAAAIGPVLYSIGLFTSAIALVTGGITTLVGAIKIFKIQAIGAWLAAYAPVIAIVAAIALVAAAVIYVTDNLKVFKQIGKMMAVSLGNAFLEIGKMLLTPFEKGIDAYNKLRALLGKEQVANPFTNMKDSLENLKGEVPKITAEFGTWGEAMKNAGDKAKNAIAGVGAALGLTGGGSEDGGSSGGGSEGGSSGSSGGDGGDGGEGGGLIQKMRTLSQLAKDFGTSMAEDFAGGMADAIVEGENFFKSFTRIFVDLLKQIGALIIKAAILAAIFTYLGAGDTMKGLSFMQIVQSSLASSIPGRASGGSVVAGQPYMVGESGAEMFVPNSSGTIVANNNLGGSVIPDVRISGSDLMLVFNRENKRRNGVNR